MVDPRRVGALLARLREEVAALNTLAGRPDNDLFSAVDALPAAKYRLLVAVEVAVDIADHVIASEELRPAQTMADSFHSLAESGVIGKPLAGALGDAARMRNLLVHQYADVDDSRVIAIVRGSLGDLDTYAVAIARFIQDGRTAEPLS